jgi:hypothetical protein
MAQLVAHLLCKQGVRGSSPLGSTIFPCQRHFVAQEISRDREYTSKVQQCVLMGGDAQRPSSRSPSAFNALKVESLEDPKLGPLPTGVFI